VVNHMIIKAHLGELEHQHKALEQERNLSARRDDLGDGELHRRCVAARGDADVPKGPGQNLTRNVAAGAPAVSGGGILCSVAGKARPRPPLAP
jgi:hypothetical protein